MTDSGVSADVCMKPTASAKPWRLARHNGKLIIEGVKDVNLSTSATADLFISYAWTSDQHRAWVRLFASQLHLMGYSVLIDAEVDYGVSLNGFMREAVDASHVLMIVDENYVSRVNDHPDSGVGIENKWFHETFETKPTDWLSVIFVNNPRTLLPEWLTDFKPKGFDFNTRSGAGQFPGAEQLNDVWRWINGLPAGRAHAVPLAQLRARSSRLEAIDVLRDPGSWARPAMSGRVKFQYADQPGSKFRLGNGEYEFTLQVSAGGANLIYVYSDPIKAIGLIGNADYVHDTVEKFISPGRVVRPVTGQSVVLMNHDGNLCVVTIEDIQDEINGNVYTAPHVTFSYEIVTQE